MPTIEINLRKPHAGQEPVVQSKARFRVIVCGRRWGKTAICINLAIETALAGHPVGWFAPDYKRLLDAFDQITGILGKMVKSRNATTGVIELINGGKIEFWTLVDKDAGRSRKYKRVIIDEAGMVLCLAESWRESIRPTLIDLEGDAIFAGTPKPPQAVPLSEYAFYAFYQRGLSQATEDEQWESFHAPSSSNPHLPQGEVELMRHEPGMTARIAMQEIDALFLTESTNALWSMELIKRNRAKPPEGVQYIRTVIFVDPGNFTSEKSADMTGIIVASLGTDGVKYVRNDFSDHLTPMKLATILAKVHAKYGGAILYESNQGGEFVKAAIQNVVSGVSVRGVWSSQAKEHRANVPLQGYEFGTVKHEYEFSRLEDEMVNWSPFDKKAKSPNRIDALCGALNELMKGGASETSEVTMMKVGATVI
jgi:hypothetical protein